MGSLRPGQSTAERSDRGADAKSSGGRGQQRPVREINDSQERENNQRMATPFVNHFNFSISWFHKGPFFARFGLRCGVRID